MYCCFAAELESTTKFHFQEEANLICPTVYTWWAISNFSYQAS